MLEVARFLADHAPFRGLEAEVVDAVAAAVRVEFFDRGTPILDQGGAPSRFVYMVRRGSVEVTDVTRVVDVLEEGDLFGFPSLLSGEPPVFGIRALDETLCYLIDGEHAREVFARPSGMRFLTMSLRDRYETALPMQGSTPATADEVAAAVLMVVGSNEPVAEVARLMTEAGATAAVVLDADEVGIVTDRDMRARVVAVGLPGATAVRAVATTPARTVAPETPIDEALITMLSLGVHHLPVVAHGSPVAMLTDLDLLGHQRRDAFRLRSEIERAADMPAAAEAGRRIASAVVPLVRAGVDAQHVGVVVSTLIDALTVRLLELAQAELGPAPGPFAWLVLGSGGRREQGLHTDQDHALVYADSDFEYDEHYRGIAGYVVEGLAGAGIPPCESKVMASEDGWRGSLGWWRARITQWMVVPETKATFLTALVFDARVVTGGLDMEGVLGGAVDQAKSSPGFLGRLTRLVVDMAVPIGFLGNLVTTDDGDHRTLDLKRGGIHPVTEMARLYALTAGVRSLSTGRRLTEAARAGVVDAEVAEALAEAHSLLRAIRLRHQVERLVAGAPPDDLVDPATLSPIERRSLRDAFRIVRDAQRDLGERVRPRVLGR